MKIKTSAPGSEVNGDIGFLVRSYALGMLYFNDIPRDMSYFNIGPAPPPQRFAYIDLQASPQLTMLI